MPSFMPARDLEAWRAGRVGTLNRALQTSAAGVLSVCLTYHGARV